MDRTEDCDGAVRRAGRIVDELATALRKGETSLDVIPRLILTVLREESWRERRIRTGKVVSHGRFVDFITAKPLEGLGENPETIKRLIHNEPETLALFETACVGPKHKHRDDGSNPTIMPVDRGKAYTLRRLAKGHPELFDAVKAGELTANQAAIKAGFRKKPEPFKELCRWWEKASPEERKAFLEVVRK